MVIHPRTHPHTHTHTHTHRAFLPMWKLVRDTSDKLATVHAQFYKMLSELAHEISEYNIAQREKAKTSVCVTACVLPV